MYGSRAFGVVTYGGQPFSLAERALDTHTSDSLLKKKTSRGHGSSAFIAAKQEGVTVSQTGDSFLTRIPHREHQADALLRVLGTEVEHQADCFIINRRQAFHSTSAFLLFSSVSSDEVSVQESVSAAITLASSTFDSVALDDTNEEERVFPTPRTSLSNMRGSAVKNRMKRSGYFGR
jgi:hypothetical protein